eukprot:1138432-Pelagomonas_calceolata.AAC.7
MMGADGTRVKAHNGGVLMAKGFSTHWRCTHGVKAHIGGVLMGLKHIMAVCSRHEGFSTSSHGTVSQK